MSNILQRTAFSTSRLLEFFNEKELQMQIGHDRESWPIALAKELIDNSLDACESAGIAPAIMVELERDAVSVSDNGPGLPVDILRRSLDYSIRVSDKNHYIAPTRGQLGNALKTVLAAPFAIDGQHGQVEVWAHGTHYTIDVSLDRIAQKPHLEMSEAPSDVKNGTIVKMHWPQVASYLNRQTTSSFYNSYTEPTPALPDLLESYVLFNPHVALSFGDWQWEPTVTGWQKWTASEPTSAHWYSVENLRNLIAAYINAGHNKSIREFVSEFRGFAGSAKQKLVTDAAQLTGKVLGDLVTDGDLDGDQLCKLLGHMLSKSHPVKPEALGVIGEAHIRRWLVEQGAAADGVKYGCKKGEVDGLPYVLEVAFGVLQDNDAWRRVVTGLNWTPALRVPFSTINEIMGECLIQRGDPVIVVAHLACPKLEFTDHGKSRLMLPPVLNGDCAALFKTITKEFTKAKRQAARQERLNERQLDELRKQQARKKMTIREACYAVMKQAYLEASTNGKYPANARQVFYKARPLVLDLCGEFYKNSSTFTQEVLPDYLADYPEATADWDVVYDDRGHLIEPHTGETIGLGTVAVRNYIRSWTNGQFAPRAEPPSIRRLIATVGPYNRYGAVLFVEKEGFNALLAASGIANRYDIAIQSTKGQTVTAARMLAEHYARQNVRIFVLHDFDKSGFEIVDKYRNSTRRYQYGTRPLITDIGLRLDDIKVLGLEDSGELVTYPSKVHPGANLRDCGATDDEIRFLVRQGYRGA
jgi:DNA topoisomerase VI subunit B